MCWDIILSYLCLDVIDTNYFLVFNISQVYFHLAFYGLIIMLIRYRASSFTAAMKAAAIGKTA